MLSRLMKKKANSKKNDLENIDAKLNATKGYTLKRRDASSFLLVPDKNPTKRTVIITMPKDLLLD